MSGEGPRVTVGEPHGARFRELLPWLVGLGVAYVALILFFDAYLRYHSLNSDVLWYWTDSLHWQTPFNPYHVPGYALTIALFRSLTLGLVGPVALMRALNLAALAACIASIHSLASRAGAPPRLEAVAITVFTLWPFVGLVNVVDPLADTPAIALFLSGTALLIGDRPRTGSFLLGLALVFHKAMWPFVALLVLADVVHRDRKARRDWIAGLLLVTPLITLWIAGVVHYQSLSWVFARSLEVGSKTRESLPLLEGLIWTLRQGDAKDIVKSTVLLALCLLVTVVFILSWRGRAATRGYSLAITVGTAIFLATLTHREIWAALRFSRLLILPLLWLATERLGDERPAWPRMAAVMPMIGVLLATQFAFAYYMARYYFH